MLLTTLNNVGSTTLFNAVTLQDHNSLLCNWGISQSFLNKDLLIVLFVDVSCRNPGTPRNGIRDGSEFKYGRRVKYSCIPGYKLVGSVLRKCMSNGRWSGVRAKCIKTGESFSEKHMVLCDNCEQNLFAVLSQDLFKQIFTL